MVPKDSDLFITLSKSVLFALDLALVWAKITKKWSAFKTLFVSRYVVKKKEMMPTESVLKSFLPPPCLCFTDEDVVYSTTTTDSPSSFHTTTDALLQVSFISMCQISLPGLFNVKPSFFKWLKVKNTLNKMPQRIDCSERNHTAKNINRWTGDSWLGAGDAEI